MRKSDLQTIKESLGETSNIVGMAALKNLAASMTSGGDPTDILELIGADKYYITTSLDGAERSFALPQDGDLTESNKLQLVLLSGPSLQSTAGSKDFGNLIFFVQYQYSENAYACFYINEENKLSYYQKTDFPSFYLSSRPVELTLSSVLDSDEVGLKAGSKALIFYTTP